jgi:chromosomal replication initiator protein
MPDAMSALDSPLPAAVDLAREIQAALPAEISEVLMPVMRLRPAAGRLVVIFPNQIWLEAFREHALKATEQLLLARGLSLHLVCRQEAATRATGEEHLFATFLEDPGNQLALAACRRAVAAPGLEHNPLYLHGPEGCGKSHLLAAIAAEYRLAVGDSGVLELNGPDFVARDAHDLADRGRSNLRIRVEEAAAILFDQVEALASRQLAQEELFHLINSCLDRGQQLVFAGRASSRKLVGIEDRLATRLSWGLAVGIETPHTETRCALLRRLSGPAADGIEAAELARMVDTFAPDMHTVVRLAERLIEGERPGRSDQLASFDRILKVIADRYDLRPGDIASKRRHRQIAHARQMALLMGRRLTAHSLVALGGMVGGRDHSTVLYGIRQAESRIKDDPQLARELSEMTQQVLARPANAT